jgi:hypothetical protein
MTITYNWIVSQMDAYPEYEDHTDVVFTVHWRLDGTDGEYSAGVYGSVGISTDSEETFTSYNELTEAQVIGWVKDALGEEQVASYEENVAQQIANQINPPVVTPPLPWSQ